MLWSIYLYSNVWYSSSHSESSFEFSPVRLPSARWSCLDSVFFFHFETNFGTSLSEKRSPSSTSTLNRRQTSVTLPVATYDFESPCLTVNCRGTRLSATVRRDQRNCCRLWHLSKELSMNEEMTTSVCREQWWWYQLEKKKGSWNRFYGLRAYGGVIQNPDFWRSVSNDAPIHASIHALTHAGPSLPVIPDPNPAPYRDNIFVKKSIPTVCFAHTGNNPLS